MIFCAIPHLFSLLNNIALCDCHSLSVFPVNGQLEYYQFFVITNRCC